MIFIFKRLYLCELFILQVKKDIQKYNDSELLQLYGESRESAYLVELYGRYTLLVYGVALKYLKNIPDAQDAVMQIWEELFEKVLKYEIQTFKSWLYTCVRNYCLMELRKNSANLFVELDEKFMEFCDDSNPYDRQETVENEKALRDCMKALPEKQRTCVRHFFVEELSYKEIEVISGFTLKMVKSFIQNGKRNLRLCIEQKGIGQTP